MTLKPPKKSDKNKKWMKKRRDNIIKIQPEYHLIITEGTKTEPKYFNTIKYIINSRYRDRIRLDVEGEGLNTVTLFEKAKKLADSNPNGYKHVWIVYDTDSFPADHINKTAELCQSNSNDDISYHPIWSNQCIELWFLLHFSFMHSDIHREEYFPKLSECLSRIGADGYSKGRADMYNVLRPYMDIAIENAKKLDCINEGKLPSNSAPGTKVYELIEKLKPYLDEAM